VAALGHDILVGAPNDSTRGASAGAVYLFDGTTGQLLQTFYSPHPQDGGHFGFSIAAFGNDRFFVGAPGDGTSGAVYLVRTGRPVTLQAGQVLDGVDLAQSLTPDFAVAGPAGGSATQGGTATAIISTASLNGFAGSIDLSVSNLPPGVTASLSHPNVAVGDTSTLVLFADPTASTGAPVLATVTATSGSLRHQLTIPLTVPPSRPDFSLTAAPAVLTLAFGGSASTTISTAALGGLQGPITLAVPDPYPGVSASFSATSVPAGGTSTLTLTIDPASYPGAYFDDIPSSFAFDVTASSGSATHEIVLSVSIPDTGNFTSHNVSGSAPYIIVSPPGTTLENFHALDDPDPTGGLPAGTSAADFPFGFWYFEVHGLTPGEHIAVTIYLELPPGETVNQFFKFGSTPHWYAFSPYDPSTDTGAEIVGNEIILHLVDGQLGDDDLSANGVIVDPGGPAVVSEADLSLSMQAAPGQVTVGQDLTYTLTVTNPAPIPDTGVVVTDPLPAGAAFLSAVASQGACVNDNGTLRCTLGTLAPGASATITLQLKATATGGVTNTASVAGDLPDPVAGNNSATATLTVQPARPGPWVRFVTVLYAQILDRAPDPGELSAWVGRLKAGVPTARVAHAIYGLPERRRLVRQHHASHVSFQRAYFDALQAEGILPPGSGGRKARR
jgi:uncharacterized repeat protein (TIGR01451 family)